ncbi:MAG: EscD/YscD/HrpQ family type III secretion system inner membrane ring protein [Betaproteobacteria bacterium]|nr:EscD/YscD/HrpQ family type III secretion system inner membrane ring protein [Betaproteobacteria bacterium]
MNDARKRRGEADTTALELRLLAGVHAGASLLLSPGESLTIGRSRSCDVVVHDAPFDQARLEASAEGWLWLEPDGTQQAIPRGQGLSAGPLVLTVQSTGESWSGATELPIAWVRPEAGDGNSSGVFPRDTNAADINTDGEGLSPNSASASPSSPSDLPEATTPVTAWLLAPGAILVGLAWYAAGLTDPFLRLFRETSVELPVAAAPALPAGADAQDLARVVERIAAAGFNDVVRAALRADGRIEVTGVLESVDEQDQVIQLLSPERRWLALALLTQAEFAERVRDAARLLPEGFGAEALPGGRVRLTGLVLRSQDDSRARSILEERLPQTVAMVSGLTTPEDAAAQLGGELQGLGFGSVKVAWADARISIDGMIPRERAATWEQILLRFNQRFSDRLPARVALTLSDPAAAPSAAATAQPVLPPPKLPRIVAIQSGPLSYLLFADGQRVLPGGIVNGYRLAAISDTELVFEDANGASHRLAR